MTLPSDWQEILQRGVVADVVRMLSNVDNTTDRAVAPFLGRLADHSDWGVRLYAMTALYEIYGRDELDHGQLADVLMRHVTDESNSVRNGSVEMLGLIGWRPAIPLLLKQFPEESWDVVRMSISTALGLIGEFSDEVFCTLVSATGDSSILVQDYALEALARLGALGDTEAKQRIAEALRGFTPREEQTLDREFALYLLGESRPELFEILRSCGPKDEDRLRFALATLANNEDILIMSPELRQSLAEIAERIPTMAGTVRRLLNAEQDDPP